MRKKVADNLVGLRRSILTMKRDPDLPEVNAVKQKPEPPTPQTINPKPKNNLNRLNPKPEKKP